MTQAKLFVLYDEQHVPTGRAPIVRSAVPSSPSNGSGGMYVPPRHRGTGSSYTREIVCTRQVMGSLRPEAPPIKLFSSDFLGLAVTALIAGFVVAMLKSGYLSMLSEVLRARDESYPAILQGLFEWPTCFSVFMGFLSDSRPINGRRRKPYMIIGFGLAALMLIGVALVDYTSVHSWQILAVDANQGSVDAAAMIHYGPMMIALSLGAITMLQVMNIATLSMTVEFAQREMLLERGRLQATFYTVFIAGFAIARAVVPMIVHADERDRDRVQSTMSLGAMALMLAGACCMAIPFIVKFLNEPYMTRAVHMSVGRRMHEFWRFCHQDVVSRILVYIVAHLFLIGIYNGNARSAVAEWCQITGEREQGVMSVEMIGGVVSLAVYARYMINVSWHKFAGWCSLWYITTFIVLTVIVTYDVSRSYEFYVAMVSLLGMPRGWIKLFAMVIATEVADHGREGVILGLVVGFQSMVVMLVTMFSTQLGYWFPFSVAIPEDTALDSMEVRNKVLSGSMIGFSLNLMAIALVFVLPKQKYDTQQRRAVGGFNRFACYGIALTFVLLFIASCVANIRNLA